MTDGVKPGTKGNVGMQAYTAAVRRLRDMHTHEFDEMLKEERVRRGLPAEKEDGKQSIEDKIAKLQKKIDDLRAEAIRNG